MSVTVMGIAVVLLGVSWLGFPGVVSRWILSSLNSGAYYIEAHDLKLDVRGGLSASDVQVYRKGVVGPPFLTARHVRVLYRLLEWPRANLSRIKELRMSEGVIRSDGGGQFKSLVGPVSASSSQSGDTPPGEILPSIAMRVFLADFDVVGIWTEKLQADLRFEPGEVRVSQCSGWVGRELNRGSIEGNLAWMRDKQFTGRVVTSFDPRALLSACRQYCPKAVPVFERFSFSSAPPRFDLSFEGSSRPVLKLHVSGRMQASQYAYRGAKIAFANVAGDYWYGNGTNRLDLDPFLIVVGGRNAEGRATYDFAGEHARFEVVSAIDLATVLRVSGVRDQSLGEWRLDEGARVVARGQVDYRNPDQAAFEGNVDNAAVGYGLLDAKECSFRFLVAGRTNRVYDMQGKIGNGSCAGGLLQIYEPGRSNWVGRLDAELIHVDVNTILMALTRDERWRTSGKIYGKVEVAYAAGFNDRLKIDGGEGQMTLRDVQVLRLPLFSGLMVELRKRLPEFDFTGSNADGFLSFRLSGGRFVTRDCRLDCNGLQVVAEGSCGLDGTLDFSVGVSLMKRQGFLSETLGRLLSAGSSMNFRLGGTLSEPRWMFMGRR